MFVNKVLPLALYRILMSVLLSCAKEQSPTFIVPSTYRYNSPHLDSKQIFVVDYLSRSFRKITDTLGTFNRANNEIADSFNRIIQHEFLTSLLKSITFNTSDQASLVFGRLDTVGIKDINLVLKRLQNALITRGYITSSVGAVPQDLNSGSLTLLLTVGRIAAIRYEPDDGTGPNLTTTLPAKPGDVLNLRDIEQGYENLKRVPTADSEIKIVPSGQTGFSDLVISRKAGSPLRGAPTLDDGGMRSTGRYQGNLTLAWDNPHERPRLPQPEP